MVQALSPTPSPITTYIALGSNLNHPTEQIKTAILALKQIPYSQFITVSPLYQTAPQGFKDQPDFINAVACLETTLTAPELLITLQTIENNQGRIRKEKNGPRTLDLDILLYGNETINKPGLIIPHPRLEERSFVLIPLFEIAPTLILPNGSAIKDLLAKLALLDK